VRLGRKATGQGETLTAGLPKKERQGKRPFLRREAENEGKGIMRKMRIASVALVLAVGFVVADPAWAADRDRSGGRDRLRALAPRADATLYTDATLYEVTETVRFDSDNGVAVTMRDAIATLLGWAKVGTPLCPAEVLAMNPGAHTCTITGQGQDAVSLVTGQGPVWGKFAVVVEAPGNSAVHVPDLPVMAGSFKGTVDLSPAVLSKTPLGYLRDGKLTIDQTGQTVAFSGKFRLPFAIDNAGQVAHPRRDGGVHYYLADDLTLMAVSPTERDLGFPLVRLEITFGP
jgi:hypothetical protein